MKKLSQKEGSKVMKKLSLIVVVMLSTLFCATPADAQQKKGSIAPTYKRVPYGSDKRQVVNFWKAESKKPTPLLIYIHGGGWLTRSISDSTSAGKIARGYSYAEIGYRLAPKNPLPAPVLDAARGLQLIRSKAKEWNIDTDKIVVTTLFPYRRSSGL